MCPSPTPRFCAIPRHDFAPRPAPLSPLRGIVSFPSARVEFVRAENLSFRNTRSLDREYCFHAAYDSPRVVSISIDPSVGLSPREQRRFRYVVVSPGHLLDIPSASNAQVGASGIADRIGRRKNLSSTHAIYLTVRSADYEASRVRCIVNC